MFHIPGACSVQFRPSWHIYIFKGPHLVPCRGPWSAFNSSVFLHPVCVTGGGNPWQFSSHSFRIGAATAPAAFQITLSRPWAGGPVMYINSTLESLWNQFWKFLGGCFSNRYLIKGGSIHIRSGDFGFGRYGLGRLQATSPFSEP